MAKWNTEEWESLYSGETCPICRNGKPLNIVAELEASFVTSSENGPMRGYCCVVAKRHVVELHDLTTEEGAALMADVQKASKAVKEITGAVKMNYEVHGNTIPHLHFHLFPRYRGDRFEGRPIDPKLVEGAPYSAGEFGRFVASLKERFATL